MATKRERINPGRGGARFVRRNEQGEFKEVESVGRSLKQDRARKAKNTAKSGQGDRGDRKVSGNGSSKRSSRTNKRSAPMKKGGGRKSGGGRTGTAKHAARR